jgi:hypothetical protein
MTLLTIGQGGLVMKSQLDARCPEACSSCSDRGTMLVGGPGVTLMSASYFVFVAKPLRRARVHLADCKHCRNGQGQENQDKNGSGATEWFGPFGSRDDAFAKMMALHPKDHGACGHCRP